MTGSVGNNPNDVAYNNVKKETIHASADCEQQDGKITLSEAKKHNASVFSQAETKGNQLIDDIINSSTRLSAENKANAKSVVEKYLGGKTFAGNLGNWDGFSEINYQAKEISDSDFASNVQAEIDNIVNPAIENQVKSIASQVSSDLRTDIEKALAQAENELVGDADIVGNISTGKPDKKGITSNDLEKILYKRTSDETGEAEDENTNVATFNSSQNPEKPTAGYFNTVAYLKSKGAKAETKLVNGKEQTVFKIKIDGENQYVTVDDAGQVHTTSKNKGFLRKSKFTTEDSIADAKQQAQADGVADNDIPDNAKVKVRKVDGQLQSVITWKDENGVKHARVIDQNEVSGLTSSADVHHVNAGGRAKYSSDTSGLGAYAQANADDPNIGFNNGKFQDGTVVDSNNIVRENYVGTQRGRAKLDAQNIGQAITNISDAVTQAGGNVAQNGNNTEVTINGHKYTIDPSDIKGADRTMRLLQGEIDRIPKPKTPEKPQDVTVDTSHIVEDSRVDTNDKTAHQGEKWRVGSGDVQDVGVNNPASHQSSAGGKGKINSVRYGADLSRQDWRKEGWTASKDRSRETAILKAMDENKGDGLSTRNLKTANEFAERFVKAMQVKGMADANKTYDLPRLARAIVAANPSLFDADGNMYKNCDFSRLNLPKDISRYV